MVEKFELAARTSKKWRSRWLRVVVDVEVRTEDNLGMNGFGIGRGCGVSGAVEVYLG